MRSIIPYSYLRSCDHHALVANAGRRGHAASPVRARPVPSPARRVLAGIALLMSVLMPGMMSVLISGLAGCGHDSRHDNNRNTRPAPSPEPAPPTPVPIAELAWPHIQTLSSTIGLRVAGTPGEERARDYIAEQLAGLGYSVEQQSFSFDAGSRSTNVIATKPGRTDARLLVGAHYDSTNVGLGASDNASGTAALLALAQVLADRELPFTLVLIAFGAEERGMLGAAHYLAQMDPQDTERTVGMINLDSLFGGDFLYVHAGPSDSGWLRDQALAAARALDIDLRTNPGLNPEYPAGTTGPWGDHTPFMQAGMAIAHFESTNWEVGELDGYTQTATHGSFWHTPRDTVSDIEAAFPGRTEAQLRDMLAVLERFLTTLTPPPSNQSGKQPAKQPDRSSGQTTDPSPAQITGSP